MARGRQAAVASDNDSQAGQIEVVLQPPRLNAAVAAYCKPIPTSTQHGVWMDFAEMPSTEELLQGTGVSILPNVIRGSWASKGLSLSTALLERPLTIFQEAFLEAHYRFLREEVVRPLREAIARLKNMPNADEASLRDMGIYESVQIIGFTPSTRDIAIRVSLSTRRVGKKILWKQSKRLRTGSLVAITPSDDCFKTKTILAVVAARPLELVEKNPPELDLFFARAEELEIDPSVEWIMVEANSGYFEAHRHTMVALQRMMHESFPFQNQLVKLDAYNKHPSYLHEQLDLTSVLGEAYKAVGVDQAWEVPSDSTLDKSQLSALQRVVTRALALIQGPPGTGKTFVSVLGLKVMLANRLEGDPPIVITCQTNHALDQLLRHLAEFETNFIRLGAQSQDDGIVKERTLYEQRLQKPREKLHGCSAPSARAEMQKLSKRLGQLMDPIKDTTRHLTAPLDLVVLQEHGILSELQAQTLEAGASKWVQAKEVNSTEADSPFRLWLGHTLTRQSYKPKPEDYGFVFEEAELEFEELQDIEAEGQAKDDYKDALYGDFFTLADNYTCSRSHHVSDAAIERLLRQEQDMWKIPQGMRGPIYLYMQRQLKSKLLQEFRRLAVQYKIQASKLQTGRWEQDELILREAKVIGMTTTALSKNRALISALKCKVVLVEEAAETLEAPLIAGCIPSLEHLILVGDHKQLRPHCSVREHEHEEYNWNISLFERLVNNDLEMTMLATQRRMAPEISRLMRPIYGNTIKNHESVKLTTNRPDVPGMNGINSLFFHHEWPERRDDMMSSINEEEADMIAGFFAHLVHNGTPIEEITVLTFYNGQRKRILRRLLETASLWSGMRLKDRIRRLKVYTVDSYQGEENKIVILSLVRSNSIGTIGFLDNQNRVCVALSRAQCGFYIFGNAHMFNRYHKSKEVTGGRTWCSVFQIMFGIKHTEDTPSRQSNRVIKALPITCQRHSNTITIEQPSDWQGLSGGCRQACDQTLNCGHKCTLACHTFEHEPQQCNQACDRTLACGHKCSKACKDDCACKSCNARSREHSEASRASSAEAWQTYGKQETQRYARAAFDASVWPSQRNGSSQTGLLVDIEIDTPAEPITGKDKAWEEKENITVSVQEISLLD